MGQANRRGTFEERKAQAIERKRAEYEEQMRKTNEEQLRRGPAPAIPKRKHGPGTSFGLFAALALALTPSR